MNKLVALSLAVALMICLILPVPAQAAGAATYTVSISYSAKMISNNHVGNSWAKGLTLNGKSLSSGKTSKLTLKDADSFSISCWATERDTIPDTGSTDITVNVASLKVGKTTLTKNVVVTENRGRYSGNTATWKFTITISKAKKR